MNRRILLLCLSFLLLASCRKTEPRLGGRVITVRGGDLVPHARVVFLGAEGGETLFSTTTFHPLGETVSDALGHFEIPDNEEIHFIMALPPNDEYYTDYARPFGTETYFSEGGIFECMVEAASWVRLSAVDVEPLNPDSYVELVRQDNSGNYIELDEPYLIKTRSDESFRVVYGIVTNGVPSLSITESTPVLEPGDTIDYVIEY